LVETRPYRPCRQFTEWSVVATTGYWYQGDEVSYDDLDPDALTHDGPGIYVNPDGWIQIGYMEAGLKQGPYTIIYDDGYILQGLLDKNSVNTG
jgi:hypothetical protein